MTRQTKIVATLGPATDAPDVLQKLIAAGVDVVRLNFSHGSADDHRGRAAAVRAAAEAAGRDVGILVDLPGPKIRIESFSEGAVELQEGARFVLDTAHPADAGTVERVGVAYTALPKDVRAGDHLLLNDGLIRLRVEQVRGTAVHCTVELGGRLSNRKGLNKLGGGLSAPALTEADRRHILTAVDIGADFLAVSFPKTGDDMKKARWLAEAAGGHPQLVAKIERTEAVDNLAEILAESEVVMVARGDLGVEIGEPALPGVQKRIIREAREANRVVITATQMMESMISNPIPTRAEVLDVANAVMDGTDAVMLSAETAAGQYPVQAVQAMARICQGAEQHDPPQRAVAQLDSHFARIDEAIAMAAVYTARHTQARAIISLTESGMTAVWMSRMDTRIPVYALTRHETTRRRMALVRGTYPVDFVPSNLDGITASSEAIACLRERGLLSKGDRVIVTKGDFNGPGGTNSMKVLRVDGS
ncbi:MAG: pyruvate kinase [Oceanococcaceae bacterium]